MQNIVVGRYAPDEAGGPDGWAGWIEPEDHSWILFVHRKGGKVVAFLNRDPVTGAVLPN